MELIDFAFSRFDIRSFADLGGVWRVEGGYTFHALGKHNVSHAFLVDTHPTEIVRKRAAKFPRLKLVTGDFGDEEVAREAGDVEAVFFFDVLLHQVNPDWDRILEMYARARCFIIYNQQWTGAHTTRLLELGEDEYFRNVPHDRTVAPYNELFKKLDEKHPEHDRKWRDVHHIWQWGITDKDLRSKVESLGFREQYMKNFGAFGNLKNFENHGFVFSSD
ncbi:MAG TPA: class I SAM-dependent methyltransferase [Pyrinomonadaceae bacterium]|nr:class I SAM-dependent methyltransferase [Pyrinomonadaceae bacterium]